MSEGHASLVPWRRADRSHCAARRRQHSRDRRCEAVECSRGQTILLPASIKADISATSSPAPGLRSPFYHGIFMKNAFKKSSANAGVASRRNIEEMVRDGRIAVNGKVVRELPILVDPEKDRIEVDGETVRFHSRKGGPPAPSGFTS